MGGMALASACKPGATGQTATGTTPTTTTTAQPVSSEYVPGPHPSVIPVPNSSCNIAPDRLYSLEHVWVKQYGPDLVALGITPSLIAILYEPYKVDVLEVGTILAREDSFGEVVGYKTVADLTMPVSGTIIQRNEPLLSAGKLGAYLTMLNAEPFGGGWLAAVKLNKPEELKDLMDPDGYMQRLVNLTK